MNLNKLILITVASAGISMACACSGDEPEADVNGQPSVPEAVTVANSDIIYEVNPRFYGTDGCIAAVTADLDNIKAVGTTVLWLMPVNEFGKEKSVNSPYCIKNFKAVDPKMGSEADLKTLVDRAHAKGMKVIMDWIANHTSWDNVWIAEHKDWYTRDNNGNIISPAGTNWNDVADLNFDNKDMRAAMIDAMTYWITAVGIDGYRCDHVDGVPVDFWSEAISALRNKKKDCIMLAESADMKYFDAGFDLCYGWKFAGYLSNLFLGKSTVAKFYESSDSEIKAMPQGKRVMRYALNHDTASESSLRSLYGSDKALEAAMVLAMMLDGVPMIYSADLIDYSGTIGFFDYGKKTFNSEKIARLKKLGDAYVATQEARCGKLVTYQAGGVVMFSRSVGSHTVLVAVNPGSSAEAVKLPMTLSGTDMTDVLTGATSKLPISLNLDGYQYAVYYR